MARAVGLICFAAAPVAAEAQTYTWSGAVTAGPHDWTVDANWSGTPNAVPGLTAADDVANLTANWTAAPTINLNSVVTLGTLTINDTGGDPDVSITLAPGAGGAIIFATTTGAAVLNNSSNTGGNVVSAPITLNASLNIGGGNSFSLTGNIDGPGTLTKNANTNLTLSGVNTFAGGVNFTAGGLNVNNASALGTGDLTISGGTLGNTSAAGITLSTNNTQTWSGNFTFGGSQSLNLGTGAVTLTANRSIAIGSSSDTLTVGGVIGGAGFSLTTTNVTANVATGILGLSGANTYDGGTTINGGVVRFNSAAAIPATGTIAIQSGGALAVAGARTTLAAWLADTRLSNASTGALALAGDSSENFAPGTAGFNTISLGSVVGGTRTYTGTYTPGTAGYFVGGGGGTIIFSNTNAFTGANALTVGNGGGGTVILTGDNNYTGTTTINTGATLQLGNATAAGGVAGTTAVINNGTLNLNRTDATAVAVPLTGTGTLAIRGAGAVTLSALSTQGTLDVQTAGTRTLAVSSLTLTGGGTNAFIVGNQTPDGSATSFSVTSAGGPGTGTLTINNSASDIFIGQNGANNSTTPVPTASVDLSDLGTFTATVNDVRISTSGRSIGQLTLAAGVNTITADNIFVATQATTGTSGSFLALGQSNTIHSNVITISGGRTSGSLLFQSGLTDTPTVNIRGKAGGTTRANLYVADQTNTSGSGSGAGGSSDPAGLVDFTAGSVNALLGDLVLGIAGTETSSSIGAGRGTLRFNAGTIDVTNAVLGRANSITSGSVNNDSAQGTLEVQGNANLIAGTITLAQNNDATGGANPGAIGTLRVTGGTVNVSGSIVAATHTSTGPTAATALIELTGGVTTVGGDIAEGAGSNNNSTLTIDGGALDMTAGPISVDTLNLLAGSLSNVTEINAGAPITKTGAGTLTLGGTNTYTGQTNVAAGTLLVNGSLTSAVVATAGTTVGGSGSIAANLTLTGGTLSPGNSPGQLTVTGTTTATDTSMVVELNGGVPGTGYDQLVTNGITLAGTSSLSLTLGFAAALNDQFTVINNTAATAIAGTFGNLPDGGSINASFGGNTYTFVADYDAGTGGNDLVLTVTAVPEPATAGAFGVATLGLLARRRRRR